MKFETSRQFGLGNRKYTLTENFEFFGVTLPIGLTVDGSSVPKVPILFLATLWLLFSNELPFSTPSWVDSLVVVVMLLVGICESSGWFMKPAAVHDYRFQNASTAFGWFPANIEYFVLMLRKVFQYSNEKPSPFIFQTLFHLSLGLAIALAHLFVLTLFGWYVWYGYYSKNKRLGKIV
ncbi:hypothetical protein CXF85_21130 [Colwellia sp. 75C3]|uniref:hypothetical protein n=1 Tax=Colwellia sp. 75C3 TaxID=888425 RepID=UPI000C34A01C|nr:hypothetical protein [Colwellia sp. 75C3]PKG80630.1 hypothetical protein CXF85_21130 [Colwellia sp. 75C3]